MHQQETERVPDGDEVAAQAGAPATPQAGPAMISPLKASLPPRRRQRRHAGSARRGALSQIACETSRTKGGSWYEEVTVSWTGGCLRIGHVLYPTAYPRARDIAHHGPQALPENFPVVDFVRAHPYRSRQHTAVTALAAPLDGRLTSIHSHSGSDTLIRKTLRSVLQATRWPEHDLRRLALLT
jgi:hypothetical protein